MCTLKEKQPELSIPNLVHIYSMAGLWYALTLRSEGQGRRVVKYAASMNMQLSMLI